MSHLIDISILKQNRQFRLLFLGQMASFMGTALTIVALPYQIYQLTHSTLMIGLLSLAQLLPVLVTALVGGVYADRYNRQRILLLSEALMALGCLVLAFNAQLATPRLWVLFVVAPTMAAINGLHRPAFDGLNQQLLAKNEFKAAGALLSFKYSFSMIIGPAVAGVLIAYLGLVSTYFLDLLSFLISIPCLLALRPLPKPANKNHSSLVSSIKEGINFARKSQTLLGSYLVDFIAMIGAMPTAVFPAIAETLGGAQVLGMLYAAPAVGTLLISLFSGFTSKIHADGKAIAISAGLWGLAIIVFGLVHHLAIALFCLALAGAADAVSGIFRMNLWNHTIPQEMRGRLAGIEMISYLSGPRLGDLRAGLFTSWIGLPAALVSGGIICIAGVFFCCVSLPQFWNYREGLSNTSLDL